METIDSNFFSIANEMSRTEQVNEISTVYSQCNWSWAIQVLGVGQLYLGDPGTVVAA